MTILIFKLLNKHLRIHFIFSFILFVVLFIIHTRGIALADEGYILQAGQRIATGELPYKDFFIAYTPLSAFFTAGSLLLFGQSILSSRILALVVSLLTCLFLFKLIKSVTKNTFISYLSVIFFVLWGPMHTNFSWPVIYTNLFSIQTAYYLHQSLQTKKTNNLFWVGLFSTLTFLSKQNFGFAIFCIVILVFLTNKLIQIKKNIVDFLLGLLLPILFFVIYLYINNLWPYFIENYYFYFLKKMILDGNGSTPFLYQTTFIKDSIKLLFYLSPILLSLPAAYLAFVKKRTHTFIPLFVILYYLTGIRPVTDFVHLTPLIAISSMSLAIFLYEAKNKYLKALAYFIVLAFFSLGTYSAIFGGYYKWEVPIYRHNLLLSNNRINIYIDEKHKNLFNYIETYIEKNTQKDEYVFVNDYKPLINFITDRKNPTRFIYLHPNVVDYKYQLEVERNLEEKNVKVIITSSFLSNDKSHLSNYIRKNYQIDQTKYTYTFWRKNTNN